MKNRQCQKDDINANHHESKHKYTFLGIHLHQVNPQYKQKVKWQSKQALQGSQRKIKEITKSRAKQDHDCHPEQRLFHREKVPKITDGTIDQHDKSHTRDNQSYKRYHGREIDINQTSYIQTDRRTLYQRLDWKMKQIRVDKSHEHEAREKKPPVAHQPVFIISYPQLIERDKKIMC